MGTIVNLERTKLMNKQLYVVNKTDTNLQFKQGFLIINRGGFKAIRAEDVDHPDFAYALERDWIEITDKKPEIKEPVGGVKVIETVNPYRGMTSEEYRAEKAREAQEKAEREAVATSEAVGRQPETSEEAEAVVDEVSEPVEAKTEAAPKRGRKASKAAE